MDKKPSTSSFSFFFKRLHKKTSAGGGARRWKLKTSSGLRWKSGFNLYLWFVDHVLFKVVTVLESVFLISRLCFFFLCCGCHL